MNGYAKLTRLPAPTLAPVDLGSLVRRTAALDRRLAVRVADAPAIRIRADEAQLEQLLINLLRNAVDAALETGGDVTVSLRRKSGFAEVCIADDGPGLSSSANLFVPFFTTKPGGSGIGLVLSREIAEAHGGSLTVANRASARGVEAVLRLPL
jgi:signal transduction histidine kinase